MNFSRILLAATAFVGLAAFNDPFGKFSVDFPDGWSAPEVSNGVNKVTSPDGTFNCNAYAPENAALASATQEQINAEFSKPLDQAGWASLLGVKPDLIVVSETEARPVGKTFLQVATIVVKKEAGVAPMDAKARLGLYVLPGYMINAGCYAPLDKYDTVKDIFEKTISSLKPL